MLTVSSELAPVSVWCGWVASIQLLCVTLTGDDGNGAGDRVRIRDECE